MGTKTQALPKLGDLHEGGIYAGITTGKDGAPYALILMPDAPEGEIKWQASVI